MSNAVKFLDPNTNKIVFKDCVTGADLTAAQIASILPCPTRSTVDSDVCLQPTGNTDPALVVTGGKQICTIETTYLADGSVDTVLPVGTPLLLDSTGSDVTSTMEVTACPVGMVYAGEVCYEA